MSELRGKPIFLFGESQGGTDAIKHAEEYPDTFSGYISFDGALSLKRDVEERPKRNWSESTLSILDAMNGIENIKNPILVIHNFDDNNVPIQESLDWYKKAVSAGKRNLVRLLLSARGSPIKNIQVGGIFNKGHNFPLDHQSLVVLGNYILRFMLNGPSAIPAAGELKAHSYELYAYRNLRNPSVIERLLSEAIRHYDASKPKSITDELWRDEYLPIFLSIY